MSAHTHTHAISNESILFVYFPHFPLPIFVSYFCVCNPAFGKQNKSLIVCVCVCVGRIFPFFSFDVSLSLLFFFDLFNSNLSFYNRVPFNNNSKTIYIHYIFIQRYYCYCAYVSVCVFFDVSIDNMEPCETSEIQSFVFLSLFLFGVF